MLDGIGEADFCNELLADHMIFRLFLKIFCMKSLFSATIKNTLQSCRGPRRFSRKSENSNMRKFSNFIRDIQILLKISF